MTLFGVLAAVLIATALVFVLWPLLRKPAARPASMRSTNLAIYRDQFAELERDLDLGTLDHAQYEAARAELQRRMLDDVGDQRDGAGNVARGSRVTALLIALALPVTAGVLYAMLGQPEGIGAAKRSVPDSTPVSAEDFAAMTEKLAERMRNDPGDPIGWLMLGRAYKALERYPEAVDALAEADRRRPADAEIMIEYAEALAQMNGTLAGQPRRLLERALTIAPNDAKALTMAGGAAFEAHEYRKAIAYWEKVSIQVPKDSELGQALAAGIERARTLEAGGTADTPVEHSAAQGAISGRVSLAAEFKDNVAPNDTVFIFARAAQGARMPLAIVRMQVKDLPAMFALDDSSAMNDQARLSQAGEVIVTARVSRSGNATPASGDLQGESKVVAPGANGVMITIDQVLP